MEPRLNFFKSGPEAMKAMAGLDQHIARSGLEKSLVELVRLGDRLFKRPFSSQTAPRRHPEHVSTGEERSARSARSARTCLWMQAAIC